MIRSGVSPFDSYRVNDYLDHDLGGGNSGNLLFASSVFRLLNGNGYITESNYYKLDEKTLDYINSECSCFVIPLANAFRENFREMPRLTKFVKKLKVPCIVVGVGGQFELSPDFHNKRSFDEEAFLFCKEVLNKSSCIGVRGVITADYLKSIGIPEDNIEVIGCPSVFFHGTKFATSKNVKFSKNVRLAINAGANINKKTFSSLLNLRNYIEDCYFIPQGNYDLRILYYGTPFKRMQNGYPDNIENSFYKENKVKFFINAQQWIDWYKNIDYACGIKIHGSIAALLGGSKPLLIATDSRTKELAEWHKIPYIEDSSDIDEFKLMRHLDSLSINDFCSNYNRLHDNYISFLNKNKLDISYDYRLNDIKATDCEDVKSILQVDKDELILRINHQYNVFQRQVSKLKQQIIK